MIWFIVIYIVTIILEGVFFYFDMDKGETLEQCLCRELIEELALEIEVKELFMKSEHLYDFGGFVLNTFIAECKDPNIKKVCEHEQYAWVEPKDLLNYDLAPADIPIAEAYINSLA